MLYKWGTISIILYWFTFIFGNSTLKKFPKDFKFGVSTSAYQTEGGWIEDGKGWSTWDYKTHTNTYSYNVARGANADVSADSYHLYKRDVEMLQELGVQVYKFSISWPRILPSGLSSYVNPKGIQYYDALIDELLSRGIEPIVGIFHWDLPMNLYDMGGFLNDEFPTWYAEYSRILFQNFGDRVKYWVTFNEPVVYCGMVYIAEWDVPARTKKRPGQDYYDCTRNTLLAHAKAYHIYDEEYRPTQKGKIAISVLGEWCIPRTNTTEDIEATKNLQAHYIGMYMDPIYSKKGNYPQRTIDRVGSLSAKQGFNTSRLRPLTHQEVDFIKGTSDFVALNHYTSYLVYRLNDTQLKTVDPPSIYEDNAAETDMDPAWERSTNEYFISVNPQGLYDVLIYLRDTYDNPEIYMIETGFRSKAGLVDNVRISCMRDYLAALQNAMKDGVKVLGFCFWSLMDNFQWDEGYKTRFGLYEVDMKDPARPRTARKSALVYKEIIRSRVIDYSYNPDVVIGGNGAVCTTGSALIGLVISILVLFVN